MKYKLLLLSLVLFSCSKDNDDIVNPTPTPTPNKKYELSQTYRSYNQPHHITRNSPNSWINVHEIMIRNGVNWVGPDQSGPAFADWNGDGYEDIIVSPLSINCWTCEGEVPQLYIYDTDLGDFIYEPMIFTSNENEILNRMGNKIIGDFEDIKMLVMIFTIKFGF
jgi:hypothetical protein